MKKTLLFLTFLFNFSLYAQGTCATALTVVSGSTYNTGVINGTHIGGCYTGTVPTNGIWYTFTTTAAGFMRINTNIPSNPTTGDSRISVFTGTCSSLVCVAANDDVSTTNYLSDLEFTTTANTTYYIQFDNRWGLDANNLNFEFNHVNADCSIVSTFPYSKGITNWKPEFACYTISNALLTSRTWGWNNVNDINGDTVPDQIINIFPPATAEVKDDWLFSKGITLTQGVTYEISSKFNTFNLNSADLFPSDNLEIFVVDAPTPSATFSQSIYVNNSFAPGTTTVGSLYATAYNGNGTFTPTTTGTYYLAFKSTSPANRTVLMLFELGITESLSLDNLILNNTSLFPNPATQSFEISTGNQFGNIQQVSVTDINGRVVKSFGTNQSSYDISDLNTGIYMVEIRTENGVETKKLIKK